MSLVILIPLVVALISALGGYLGAVKRLSGTIQTSTAEDLWDESRSMRSELTDRVIALQTRLDQLLEENVQLRREVADLRIAILKMKLKYEEGAI